jgi:hypothetical protein
MSTWAIVVLTDRSYVRARTPLLAYTRRLVTDSSAKNLEAISKAIDQHNRGCPFPAAEVRMNPFEIERLGWEEIRGLPIVPDPKIGTGRFRIVCSRDLDEGGIEETEAVGEPLETVAPPRTIEP